jgi:hypothetical protein
LPTGGRLAFGISEQAQIGKVMVAFVVSLAAIGLRELDPAGLNAIDGSDMNAIGSNNFHASRLGRRTTVMNVRYVAGVARRSSCITCDGSWASPTLGERST